MISEEIISTDTRAMNPGNREYSKMKKAKQKQYVRISQKEKKVVHIKKQKGKLTSITKIKPEEHEYNELFFNSQ